MSGNLIASGTRGGSLYRWNAFTGAAIGRALQGYKDSYRPS